SRAYFLPSPVWLRAGVSSRPSRSSPIQATRLRRMAAASTTEMREAELGAMVNDLGRDARTGILSPLSPASGERGERHAYAPTLPLRLLVRRQRPGQALAEGDRWLVAQILP